MDNSEHPDDLPVLCETPTHRVLQVDDNLESAYEKFSSPKDAIQAIFRVGRPPACQKNAFRLSEGFRIVLDALTYLGRAVHDPGIGPARREAIGLIKKQWFHIGPWIDFFLDNYALIDEEDLTRYEDVDFRDNVLNVLAMVLSYSEVPNSNTATGGHSLRRMAPGLFQRAVCTWIKVMKTRHVSWPRWTLMLRAVYLTTVDDWRQFKEAALATGPNAADTLAKIATQYIVLVTHNAHRIGDREFPGVPEALFLLSGCLRYRDPSLLPFLRLGGVPALVKMIATLISKPKTVEACQGNRERLRHLFRTGDIGSIILAGVLLGPGWISQALEAGLIGVIFRAEQLYGGDVVIGPHLRSIWRSMKAVFDRTILHAVYPSVVIRFMATTKKILGSEFENSLSSRTPKWDLLDMWQLLKASMIESSSSLSVMKRKQGELCAYTQCPLQGNPNNESQLVRKTTGHQGIEKSAKSLQDTEKVNIPIFSIWFTMDLYFISLKLLYTFINISRIVEYRRSIETDRGITHEDAALVFAEKLPLQDFRRLNHCVVVINFDNRGELTQIFAPERCTAKHLKNVVADPRLKQHRQELLKLCNVSNALWPQKSSIFGSKNLSFAKRLWSDVFRSIPSADFGLHLKGL
ncbi:hypothetical protein VNI00_016888 [Paramarasmius palmivorus]|uniref:Uncharacterized protein n=1 Tax=Paramarasmius palmivorus TaxID=297713 RepID=A0AAW0BBD5_9AGAR